jgi:hypothetical protein
MARIGVISDTHGCASSWKKAMEIWKDVDFIIHCGDVLYHGPSNKIPENYDTLELPHLINSSKVPVLIAQGNCDSRADQDVLHWPIISPYVFAWWKKRIVLATHGVNFTRTREDVVKFKPDIVFTGHTHVASINNEKGTIYLNPGSASLPKGRDPASVALVEQDSLSIITLDGAVLHQQKWDFEGSVHGAK